MKTVVYIRLEIDGDPDEVFPLVDDILDEGVLQDEINDLGEDSGIHVTSAVVEVTEDD